jgi:hypothetical protein
MQKMKNHLILVSLAVVLFAGSFTDARYSGGTGDPNDPYRIATPQDLNDIGNHEDDWDKHFILVNDVNLAEYTGLQFKLIGRFIKPSDPGNRFFTGVFDGNDNRIQNFTWKSIDKDGIGLFKCVGAGGLIRNLAMENVDVEAQKGEDIAGLVVYNLGTINKCYLTGNVLGYESAGGLAAFNEGTITNCYSTATTEGGSYSIGGLVGINKGTITHCYCSANVPGFYGAGVLAGTNWQGTITDCYSTGIASGMVSIGGLVGDNLNGTITDCFSSAGVSGFEMGFGGLVGNNEGTIINCYSTGTVESMGYSAGGLVGENRGTIRSCHSSSVVSGSYSSGGLVGSNFGGTISNSYSSGSVSGYDNVGGLVADNRGRITSCFSSSPTGPGEYDVGGLVGENYEGTIINSYAKGSASGTNMVGGLAGRNYGTINSCYSTGHVAGTSRVGGLVGRHDGGQTLNSFWDTQTSGTIISAGGIGKATAAMKTKSTFTTANWDFLDESANGSNDFWRMCIDGLHYPLLSWQFTSGDFACPDGVDIFDLAFFVGKWLAECNETNNFCNCTDTNYDQQVDFRDFVILASHWLEERK